MTNNSPKYRLPAEWEPQGAVLLSWPHPESDWAYMLDEVTECFANIAEAIVRHASLIVVAPDTSAAKKRLQYLPQDRILFADVPTNDTWARDFGGITVFDQDGHACITDFKFNGWGLKFAADKDNLITRRMVAQGMLRGGYINRLGFVLEGGSIESDGNGIVLTTSECLLSPNRNGDLSREEIEDKLKEFFGAETVLWLDHGALEGDDTDSHIDTLARLCPENTILYVGCQNAADRHFEDLRLMKEQLYTLRNLQNMPFNLIELPLPDPIFDEEGHRLPATYANFLILNDAILLPIYGQKRNDQLAHQILRVVFPDHEIIDIDCNALIKQHGSLHCVTMQFPKQVLPI